MVVVEEVVAVADSAADEVVVDSGATVVAAVTEIHSSPAVELVSSVAGEEAGLVATVEVVEASVATDEVVVVSATTDAVVVALATIVEVVVASATGAVAAVVDSAAETGGSARLAWSFKLASHVE